MKTASSRCHPGIKRDRIAFVKDGYKQSIQSIFSHHPFYYPIYLSSFAGDKELPQ